MLEVIITIAQLGGKDYGISVEGLPEYLEAGGEAAKVHLVGCLEALTNHIKHGPTLLQNTGEVH